MPLNRPALSLGAGSRSVQDARRWVVGAFEGMGREDLRECAELAVSELVTNAILHGEPPILVRVRGTRDHPRVEVRDGSSDPPRLPEPQDLDDDANLLTFGRGLELVARASEAWGAEIESNGKVVWFTPAREFTDDRGEDPLITGTRDALEQTGELAADPERFVLLDVPVLDYTSFQNHFRELRREVRLLTLAHESDYPLARDLSAVFDTLGRPLTLGIGSTEVAAALDAGRTSTDLEVTMGRTAARGLARFVELLDLTDAFCREERMLSLARSPQQRRFQNWFLGEFVRQSDGAEPQPWRPAPGTSIDGATGAATGGATDGAATGGATDGSGERRSSVS